MAVDVTQANFESEVVETSKRLPVVVDFWAEWCGPCRTLGPLLDRAAEAREGKVVLAKLDTDANPDLAARFGIRGIPAVKAFRDGEVVAEFVGAQPPAAVEQFFDSMVPSAAEGLVQAGDEGSLRKALELEPGRVDAALALARLLHARGDDEEALSALNGVGDSFEADGLAAHIELERQGPPQLAEALSLIDDGRSDEGIEALLAALERDGGQESDQIRRVVVGALTELGQGSSAAREYRRRLAAALY